MEKGKLERAGAWVFYAGFLMELVIVVLDKSALSGYVTSVDGSLFRITFLLFLTKVAFTRYTRREWVWIAVFCALGLVSYRVSGRNEILRFAVFVAACKGISVKRMFGCAFWVTLAGCALLVLLSITGVMGGVALVADFGRGMEETRYCLGMGHPNALHCMFMMVVLFGLYRYGERLRWYGFAAVFLANVGLFLLTDSKTGAVMTALAVAGAFLVSKVSLFQGKRWVAAVAVGVFCFCLGFSVLAAAFGDRWEWMMQLDGHINGRIHALYDTVNHEGMMKTWSLFSSPARDYYFDMGFVRVFYWYGILPGVIYGIINIMLLLRCGEERDGMALVMLSVLAVYTVVEAHVVSVYLGRSPFLFLLGAYWSAMFHAQRGRPLWLWRIFEHESKE